MHILQRHRVPSTNIRSCERPEHRLHCQRALGWFWSATDCGGPICRCQHFLCHQIGPLVLNQSSLGTVANLTRPNGYWYCQILLHLLTCIVRFRLWFEPTAMVFCRFRAPKMLPQTKRNGRLGKYGWCLHEMAPIWKVNAFNNNIHFSKTLFHVCFIFEKKKIF